MKYIIVRTADEREHGIIFPDDIAHNEVARIHRASDVRFVAAGFCNISGNSVTAWGKSESTGKASRPEDAAILTADFKL